MSKMASCPMTFQEIADLLAEHAKVVRAEERERCAKVCDEHARRCQKKAMDYKALDARSYMTRHNTASSLAEQIRTLKDE